MKTVEKPIISQTKQFEFPDSQKKIQNINRKIARELHPRRSKRKKR